ncbi:MAG: hypothetical protein K2Y08_00680 [Alphaproteobacteria bacterium]|nr:hypothetical protein [Alphaproteobacteria bacterium]
MSVLNRLLLLALIFVSVPAAQADPLLEEIMRDYRATLPTPPKRAQSHEETCLWCHKIYL